MAMGACAQAVSAPKENARSGGVEAGVSTRTTGGGEPV